MGSSRNTIVVVAMVAGALGLGGPASAQTLSQTETFRLVEVSGTALPVTTEGGDGCREDVIAATLTLEADGGWAMVTQEREVCGTRVEEDEDREEGTYRLEGNAFRFVNDDEDDDGDDDADELDVEELATGTRTADGLTVRLEDGETVLVFRR